MPWCRLDLRNNIRLRYKHQIQSSGGHTTDRSRGLLFAPYNRGLLPITYNHMEVIMSEEQKEFRFVSAAKRENAEAIAGEELAKYLSEEASKRIINAGANVVVFVFGEDSMTGIANCKGFEIRRVICHLLERHPELVADALANTCSNEEDTEPASDEDADQ